MLNLTAAEDCWFDLLTCVAKSRLRFLCGVCLRALLRNEMEEQVLRLASLLGDLLARGHLEELRGHLSEFLLRLPGDGLLGITVLRPEQTIADRYLFEKTLDYVELQEFLLDGD